jgi:hypothetical protein
MEFYVKAKGPLFINWLRDIVSEVVLSSGFSSVILNNKEYYFDSEYFSPYEDGEIEQLHPYINIFGTYINYEEGGEDETRDFGGIKIRSLDDERLQLIFETDVAEFEKIRQEIINRITRIWQLEPLSIDGQQGTISNEVEVKKQNAPSKKRSNKSSLNRYGKLKKEFDKLEEETQERYREAYYHIKEYEKLMKEENEAGHTNRPTVSDEEIIEYLEGEMHWTPAERTIRRIKSFGKAGILD